MGNRRRWARFLTEEEERLRRFGDPAAVLVLDLDGLKGVDGAQGRAAGDDLIRRPAGVLRRQVRDHDLLARLGGDELRTTPAQVPGLVARLRTALAGSGVAASVGHAPHALAEGLGPAWEQAALDMYAEKERWRARAAPQAA